MSYIMNIAGKELLLHGANVLPEKVEPLLVEAHLIHVNVTRGHVLVAALQPRILQMEKNKIISMFFSENTFSHSRSTHVVFAARPLPKVLHDFWEVKNRSQFCL